MMFGAGNDAEGEVRGADIGAAVFGAGGGDYGGVVDGSLTAYGS